MQISEEKVASELECNELIIDIIKACKDNNNIKTTIDNLGTRDLYGVKIRAIGESGVSIGDFQNLNILSLGRSAALSVDVSGKGSINKIEIYPTTIKGFVRDN